MGEISMIGLDIAKNVFQVHGIDATGAVVLRRQLRRGQDWLRDAARRMTKATLKDWKAWRER